MKRVKQVALVPLLAALLILALSAGVAMAEKQPDTSEGGTPRGGPVITGTLSATSPTYDRIFTGDVDVNCNATSTDSGNDGQYYFAFPFTVSDANPIEAEVTDTGVTTLSDTVISIYCEPFDETTPAASLVAYDDDGGSGLYSSFTAADNITLTPGDVYWFVLSTFSASDTGDFEIVFSANVMLMNHAEMLGPNAILESNGDATVAWETTAEYGIDHFNVWRSDAPDGALTQVNTDPIAAGSSPYSFTDSPGAGTWYYTVQVISNHGLSELYGPDLANVPTDVSLTAFDGNAAGATIPLAALFALAVLALGGFVLRRRVAG